jgi:SAM-dependent methyltransferase
MEKTRVAQRATTTATLQSYAVRAEAFWKGTKDHDVSQNIDVLLRHIDAIAPFRILDIGCGPGRDLKTFRDLGHEAIGVDGVPAFVEMRVRTAARKCGSKTC